MMPADASAAGWMAALDPRLRVVAALLFALVIVSMTRIPALAAALTLALAAAASSGWPAHRLLRRLLPLEGFMLVLLLTLPFTVPGQPLLTLGPLAASAEGLLLALAILLKASAVVLALLALVGTLDAGRLGHALARLGVPERLVHLLLLTARQIHLIGDEYARLREAMRARAFVPRSDRHTWNSIGWLMGMLLVRSLGRSRRVLDAMRCRGFDGRFHRLDTQVWSGRDTAVLAALAALLSALLLLDRLAPAGVS
jgi:cobalt/nickel transport system permease protein